MNCESPSLLKVHLGAFNKSLDGWINTDVTPHLFISRIPLLPSLLHLFKVLDHERYLQHRSGVFRKLRYLDLTKPLPYASESVAAFFSSHVLEHLFVKEVEALVKEMHRCLAPGGICRVVVPDLEKIMLKYDREDPRVFLADIFEISVRGSIKNGHHSGYTGPFLEKLFKDSGFTIVTVQSYKSGQCPDLEKLDNRPESLFFEAIK